MIPGSHSVEDLWYGLEQTVFGWSRSLEIGGREPEGHSYRVAEYSLLLARKIGLTVDQQIDIVWGAMLHDIGKFGIPDSILLKPGKLEPAERAVIEQHPSIARNMLLPIEVLRRAIDIPYCHHERWDGKGYPRGLQGEDIPLSARLFAIVDVWDSLSTDQAYRSAWQREEIIAHLMENSGKHFDPELVKEFLVLMEAGELSSVVLSESHVPSAFAGTAS